MTTHPTPWRVEWCETTFANWLVSAEGVAISVVPERMMSVMPRIVAAVNAMEKLCSLSMVADNDVNGIVADYEKAVQDG